MSADKYPSIFSRQMETIVYISDEEMDKNTSSKWVEGPQTAISLLNQ